MKKELRFEAGKSYFANPSMRDGRQLVVACVGITGEWATFVRVGMAKRVKIRCIEGRETAAINGHDDNYFISSACVADVENAAQIIAATEG